MSAEKQPHILISQGSQDAVPEARPSLPTETGASTPPTESEAPKHPIIGVEDPDEPSSYEDTTIKFRKGPAFRDIGPDFVIDVALTTGPDSEAFNYNNVSKLINELTKAGLYSAVRQGSANSLFVFVKCSKQRLLQQYYKSSVKDWLYTISTLHPAEWNSEQSPNLTPAQKLRLIYSILTSPPAEGGVGITPDIGDWLFVNSIFPLHDRELNKEWIHRWSTKWVIDGEEINWIRNHFGEKYALYFAFLQDYFLWLIIPTVLGVFTNFVLGPYSKFFGILNIIWGVVFLQAWKRKESSLAYEWGAKGSSILETPRALFIAEEFTTDSVTGEKKGYYPKWKRGLKQLASIPLALGAIVVVVILQMLSFSLEILINQLYHGPFKSYLALLPTLVLVAVIPTAIALYASVVSKLNDWENHETEDSYETSFTQKLFALSFLTSSGGLFLTAYLYLPFGHLLRPHVDYISTFCSSYLSSHFASPERFDINGHRLQQQVLYLMGTAQVVKFAVGTVLPYVQRKAFSQAKRMTSKETNPFGDDPEETEFLAEVREQAVLPEHSVQPEYQEMVLQFSHIMLFGVVWPLAPLAALVNNWIELRGDAVKICLDVRRPIPSRTESIGSWLFDMQIITWISSITISSFLAMFGNTHSQFATRSSEGISLVNATPWTILASIIFSEHAFFILTFLVSFIFSRFQSESQIKDKQARYYLRRVSLQGEDSPVTITGELKRDTSRPIVNPAESVWQLSSPSTVLDQAKTILHKVKEMNDPNKETKKNQ